MIFSAADSSTSNSACFSSCTTSSSSLYIPVTMQSKWTGCDLTDMDEVGYEPGLRQLNKEAYCSGCKRIFWMTYDCDNQNRFGNLFFHENCKEDMQILWFPQCNVCIAHAIHNFNLQWPTLDGWWINWCEPFNWDIIVELVHAKLSSQPQIVYDWIGFKIFLFLGVRTLCFPAENSMLREEWEHKQQQQHLVINTKLEPQSCIVDKTTTQTSLKRYFSPVDVGCEKDEVNKNKRCRHNMMVEHVYRKRNGRKDITAILHNITNPNQQYSLGQRWVQDLHYTANLEKHKT